MEGEIIDGRKGWSGGRKGGRNEGREWREE